MSTHRNVASRTRGVRSLAVGVSIALLASIGVGATSIAPAAAASYTIGDGVEAFGIVATGANGGSSGDGDVPVEANIPGGTGAVVTTVVSSAFSPGDTVDTSVGTGGGAGGGFAFAGGGGGRTVVENASTSTDLVIAGGGGGAGTTGRGGLAGNNADGSGSTGGSGSARNGKGGGAGTGGDPGTGNQGNGVAGGSVNGGNAAMVFDTQGGYGAIGSDGGATGAGFAGGGGGAGYGGGGGGGHQTGGEGGGGSGGGGGGGSYSISSDRTFEKADENPGVGQSGIEGSAVVTWILQSTVTAVLGSNQGELDVSWDAPGFSTDSSQLGAMTYQLYRDGTLIASTSGTTFTDSPGAGTHDYQVVSLAPLSSKADDEVGELETASEQVTSPAVISTPTVVSVTPNSGSTSGGTNVTIIGSEFLPGATVTVGGVACAPVVVESTTKITCKTGAHVAGTVVAEVTNTDTGSASLPNAFTYTGGGSTVKNPLKPTRVVVSGGPKSARRVVRWKAPANKAGDRPVVYYRLTLNLVRCPRLIVNRKLGKKTTRYAFGRSFLLKNMSCQATRGDTRSMRAAFQVRIEAFNSAGGGPMATTRFLVRR